MNIFKLLLLSLATFPVSNAIAKCSLSFPLIPYEVVDQLYQRADDDLRLAVAKTDTSVSAVFAVLSGDEGSAEYAHAIELIDSTWERNRLFIEFLYFTGRREKRETIRAALNYPVSSVILAEVVASKGGVDPAFERGMLGLVTTNNPQFFYPKALLEKRKQPKNPMSYGVYAFQAVAEGDLRALGMLEEFYLYQECEQYQELTGLLMRVAQAAK